MKILMVIPFFTPSRGGSVEVASSISRILAYRGHDITVVTTTFEANETYIDSLTSKKMKILTFKPNFNYGLFIFTPSMGEWLTNNIRDYDIIHMHNFRSYQNAISHSIAVKNGIPYVVQAHGDIPPIGSTTLKRIFDFAWGNSILKNAVGAIAINSSEARDYLQRGIPKERISIIPNSIDASQFSDLPKRGEFRKKYNIDNSDKLALYIGRIHKIKGLDNLLKSISILYKQAEDIKVAIVGPDDGYKSHIIKSIDKWGIRDRVIFTGPLFGKEKLEAFVDADVFLLLSSYEIFGLVAFEALMCGTPTIVSDRCGCAEYLKLYECGLVAEYGNIDDLNKKIKYILNNPNAAKSMAFKGRDIIEKRYTIDNMILNVESLYESCIYNR